MSPISSKNERPHPGPDPALFRGPLAQELFLKSRGRCAISGRMYSNKRRWLKKSKTRTRSRKGRRAGGRRCWMRRSSGSSSRFWRTASAAAGPPASLDWPTAIPADWLRRLNRPQSDRELESLRRCANRNQPFGSDEWVDHVRKRFGSDSLFRPQGRPRNESQNNGS